MKARYIVNKAKRFEEKLRNLQFEIYSFQTELKDFGLTSFAELTGESGFELDVSQDKMKDVWQGVENAFCRKITSKQ